MMPDQNSAREGNPQLCDAKREATTRANEIARRIRRQARRAAKFRRLAEALEIAERGGMDLDELRTLIGTARLDRMLSQGAKCEDVTITRGAVRERQRLARITAAHPAFETASLVYRVAALGRRP